MVEESIDAAVVVRPARELLRGRARRSASCSRPCSTVELAPADAVAVEHRDLGRRFQRFAASPSVRLWTPPWRSRPLICRRREVDHVHRVELGAFYPRLLSCLRRGLGPGTWVVLQSPPISVVVDSGGIAHGAISAAHLLGGRTLPGAQGRVPGLHVGQAPSLEASGQPALRWPSPSAPPPSLSDRSATSAVGAQALDLRHRRDRRHRGR